MKTVPASFKRDYDAVNEYYGCTEQEIQDMTADIKAGLHPFELYRESYAEMAARLK